MHVASAKADSITLHQDIILGAGPPDDWAWFNRLVKRMVRFARFSLLSTQKFWFQYCSRHTHRYYFYTVLGKKPWVEGE